MTTTKAKAQAPLKVDPAVDALISQGAHFLGVTKKDLVADAVRAYLNTHRDELAAGMREAMNVLDGTNRSRLALMSGISPERIDELGGIHAIWTYEPQVWLVAGVQREPGSPDDFYTALVHHVTTARKKYNAEQARWIKTATYSDHLLPNADDRERYRLEAGARFMRHLSATVHELLRGSFRDGREHATNMGTFDLGIQVRADHGHETYVAVRVTGSVPANLVMLIFDYVPGCDSTGWFPEDALPERPLRAGEYAWSNVMDPKAAAELLDIDQ